MSRYDAFQQYRAKMNCRILGDDDARGRAPDGAPRAGATLVTKRFFSLDHQTYTPGALDAKTKELLGLVASLVLRCDDCITYHILRCVEEGVSDDEFLETFSVGLIVGGSIVIPHLRRAVATLDEVRAAAAGDQAIGAGQV